jgi:GDSL-like lipase/acylhydrolase family protein
MLVSKGIVPVSGYGWTTFTTTANVDLVGAYHELFVRHHRSRIRGNGTMKKVQLRAGTLTGITSVVIRVWRWTGSTYTLVGQSENILSQLSNNTTVLAVFTSPIQNVQEGDYVSIQMQGTTQTGMLASTSTMAGYAFLHAVTTNPGSSFNWDNASSTADRYIQIRLYADSPDFIFFGDSHIAGSNDHRSYCEDRPISEDHSSDNVTSTFPYKFAALTGYTYQNMGIGGEGYDGSLTRFDADVPALMPHFAVMHSFWNNIRTGETDYAPFIEALLEMLIKSTGNSIQFLFLEGAPLTAETADEHRTCELWEAAARVILRGQGHRYVPMRTYTGQFRAGGDPGNLWDFATGLGHADGLHPTEAGKQAMAQALYDFLNPPTDPAPRRPSGHTSPMVLALLRMSR